MSLKDNTVLLNELLEQANSLPAVTKAKLQEKSVTPATGNQSVTPDSGYDGLSKVTIQGDENLVAENIKSGVSIFGVEGTLAAGSVKRVTGTIIFEQEFMNIPLGFVPDIVMFPDFTYTKSNGAVLMCSSAAAFFTESLGEYMEISARMSDKDYLIYPAKTTQGFYVDGLYCKNGTSWDVVLDVPLNYVAVKYTP